MTDPGLVRERNEDSFLVRPDLGLFAVADGVATSSAGGLAAALAVRELERCFERARARRASSRWDFRAARGCLVRAFADADRRVSEAGLEHPQHDGMITTLAAMVVARNRVVLGHVGDSRVYRLRGRDIQPGDAFPFREDRYVRAKIERLTRDHNGFEDPERDSTETDPAQLRLLTRVVGRQPRVTIRVVKLDPGDTLMLCTDGLHGVMTKKSLEMPFRFARGLGHIVGPAWSMALTQVQCLWLINEVMWYGAPDNVTLVVVRFKKGRGRWSTLRGIDHVIHAPAHPEWEQAEDEREDDAPEGSPSQAGV